jgi:hypothetical protein
MPKFSGRIFADKQVKIAIKKGISGYRLGIFLINF